MNKKVGIERCPSYDPEEVYKALKKAVELAGDLDVAGKTLLLKPNILSDSAPEKAVSTHPAFLDAVIRLVKEMGAGRILVGDSPGIQGPGFSGKICGLAGVTEKNGAEWVDFTREKAEVPCPEGKRVKKFTLTQTVREVDLILNLPKLKTHQLMYYTGAMKNLFGLVPSLAKSTYHVRYPSRESFASMIVDLNLALKPAYALMDAIIGMEGAGPAAGKPRQLGLVLASSNFLAMDVAATTIIGYQPLKIPVNREALSRGCWLSSIDEIEYPGLEPTELRIPDYEKVPIRATSSQLVEFILPGPIRKLRHQFTPGPEIKHSICTRCGNCIRICGSRVISIPAKEEDGGKPRLSIDYSRCIRCFCCHEVCPVNAINIKKWPRNRTK